MAFLLVLVGLLLVLLAEASPNICGRKITEKIILPLKSDFYIANFTSGHFLKKETLSNSIVTGGKET